MAISAMEIVIFNAYLQETEDVILFCDVPCSIILNTVLQ